MKLLYVIDYFDNPYSGSELQLWRLLQGMQERGHDIELAVFRDTDYTASKAFPFPKKNLGITSMFSLGSILKVRRFAKWAKSERYEVLHIFFNDASILCPLIFRFYGIPVIVSRRDMAFWMDTLRRIPLMLNSWVVNRYIVNCTAVKEVTCKLEGARRDQVDVIFNGYVDGDKDFKDDNYRDYCRDVDGHLVVGIVANYHPVKRLEDAIAAVARIRTQFPGLRFAVVGNRHKELYQKLVEELGIEQQVLFLGQVPNSITYIKTFDVGLLCSESEGLSNAIIEYMKQGKPVVATRTGGNTDLVVEGKTGSLVEVADVEGLAKALSALLRDQQLRERLGRNARAFADEKFSNGYMLAQHEVVYSALVS